MTEVQKSDLTEYFKQNVKVSIQWEGHEYENKEKFYDACRECDDLHSFKVAYDSANTHYQEAKHNDEGQIYSNLKNELEEIFRKIKSEIKEIDQELNKHYYDPANLLENKKLKERLVSDFEKKYKKELVVTAPKPWYP
jgi:hemerythrin superfamily protein